MQKVAKSRFQQNRDAEEKSGSLSFTKTIATKCRVEQNQLVSRDQAVEAGSKQSRGEDTEELEDAFGQLSVVLYSE